MAVPSNVECDPPATRSNVEASSPTKPIGNLRLDYIGQGLSDGQLVKERLGGRERTAAHPVGQRLEESPR